MFVSFNHCVLLIVQQMHVPKLGRFTFKIMLVIKDYGEAIACETDK